MDDDKLDRCARCGKEIDLGQPIYFDEDRRKYHPDCVDWVAWRRRFRRVRDEKSQLTLTPQLA